MPDHLGADQRKVKEDKKEDKPIQGKCFMCSLPNKGFIFVLHHFALKFSGWGSF